MTKAKDLLELVNEVGDVNVGAEDGSHDHPHINGAGQHFHKGLTKNTGGHSHGTKDSKSGSSHIHVVGEVKNGVHSAGEGKASGGHTHKNEPYTGEKQEVDN